MKFRQLAGLLKLPAVLLSCAVLAGEKIQFSDTPSASTTPIPSKKGFQDDFSDPFDFKRSTGPGGGEFLAPIPAASPKVRDAKIEQFLDQKKNWIFSTPSDFGADSSSKDAFTGKGKDLGDPFGSPQTKSAIERYFERETAVKRDPSGRLTGAGKNGRGAAFAEDSVVSDRAAGSRDAIGSLRRNSSAFGTDPVSSSSIPEDGLSGRILSGSVLKRTPGAGDIFGTSSQKSGYGSSEPTPQQKRMMEFQKILGIATPSASLAADPVNLQNDSTRQLINPISPTDLGGANSSLGTGLPGDVPGLPRPGSRSGIAADVFAPRLSSGSSLAPSPFTTPTAASQPLQRPIVLEIPRRKF